MKDHPDPAALRQLRHLDRMAHARHVTPMVRAAMRQPAPSDELLELDKAPASEEVRGRAMAEIAKLAASKAMPW